MNLTSQVTSQIISIDAKQAAKITALVALIAVLAATYPLAGAAWAFSVHLPRKHFTFLLFIPFFYALATYFLVGLGCVLYNFAARTVGGIRIEIAEHAHETVEESAEKPARRRQAA
jgi:Ni/Fe-hydrogenase subunit HybB-like protein